MQTERESHGRIIFPTGKRKRGKNVDDLTNCRGCRDACRPHRHARAVGAGDEQYTSATEGNLTRLVLIYAGLALVLAAGIGVYLVL